MNWFLTRSRAIEEVCVVNACVTLGLTESEAFTRRHVLGGAAAVAASVATFGSSALAISTFVTLSHLPLPLP